MPEPLHPIATSFVSLAGDLLIGAEAIAEFLYGDPTNVRDVYRNPLALPFFRHGAKIAATKTGLMGEIRRREAEAHAAREETKPPLKPQPRPVARRQRRTSKAA